VDNLRVGGLDAHALAQRLGLATCELHGTVASTMDLAHAAGTRGVPAGTLVLAQEQTAGRGRGGKQWVSPQGGGLWLTLLERPASATGIEVLSIRLGLYVAEALLTLAGARVSLKWPNDLLVGSRKLGGILVEARWRDQRVDWVAIGLGLNLSVPEGLETAVGLIAGTSALAVLECIIPAMRQAAVADGFLDGDEMARYAARDCAAGRRVVQPAVGVVLGVGATGALLVETASGQVACRTGSLVFAEDG
jgi:BirA family biotin operon repressor/biotin-[acetyl-CoA-carboxylase] ligase